MMFVGRVGPLTVAVALAGRRERSRVRYPEGRVMIG
jgi:trk system potassium uptake protein TrkH